MVQAEVVVVRVERNDLVDAIRAIKIVYSHLPCIESLSLPGVDDTTENNFGMFRVGFHLLEGGTHLLGGQPVQVGIMHHHRLDRLPSAAPVTGIEAHQLLHRLEGGILKIRYRCFAAQAINLAQGARLTMQHFSSPQGLPIIIVVFLADYTRHGAFASWLWAINRAKLSHRRR